MKKTSFFEKLSQEEKLLLVEPSDAIKESYIEKSGSNLISAKILLENGRLEESVSLAYYSMYHMLTALLYKAGIKCENHTASIILLEKVFEISNKEISFAKKERIDKQYYADFEITQEEVRESIHSAEDFNKKLFDFISRIDSQKIKEYRDRLKALI
ncbi:MAG: HEPN domain-containing protein [archaeon]